jgi:hypothetical protein
MNQTSLTKSFRNTPCAKQYNALLVSATIRNQMLYPRIYIDINHQAHYTPSQGRCDFSGQDARWKAQ